MWLFSARNEPLNAASPILCLAFEHACTCVFVRACIIWGDNRQSYFARHLYTRFHTNHLHISSVPRRAPYRFDSGQKGTRTLALASSWNSVRVLYRAFSFSPVARVSNLHVISFYTVPTTVKYKLHVTSWNLTFFPFFFIYNCIVI